MMTLYFTPGACSIGIHLLLERTGLAYERRRVDIRAGENREPWFTALNPKAKVPVLHYPELTRAIYFTSKVNNLVDERLYMAVAALLAFLFRLDGELGRTDKPDIAVPDELRFDADGRLSP